MTINMKSLKNNEFIEVDRKKLKVSRWYCDIWNNGKGKAENGKKQITFKLQESDSNIISRLYNREKTN